MLIASALLPPLNIAACKKIGTETATSQMIPSSQT